MTRTKRTKIVATLGPASRDPATIERLVRSGVDVFRLNAAHCDHATMIADTRTVRRVARQLKASLAVLVDLQGPKIRVGDFENREPLWLHRGQNLVISVAPGVVGQEPAKGEVMRIGTPYAGLARDIRPRERILLDDGNIELSVLGVDGTEISTRVVHGGLLKQHKGINLPGSKVSLQSLSEKDLADLACALRAGVDFVAISFVRSAEDVRRLKALVAEQGSDAQVIAKIERPEAVSRLAAILEASDAVMIARGDMGVELGAEVVPGIQKKIIRMAIEARKPVITATQMLESMVTTPRPTRAEASDVANAIYDGTSAVMLSAETASGKYPLRAVRIMSRIIRRAETDMFGGWEFSRRRRRGAKSSTVTMATVQAAAYAALLAEARVIAVFTESGATAQLLAGERTDTRIVAFTPFQRTVQRLALVWGVTAVKLTRTRTSHEMTLEGERLLLRDGLAKRGDQVITVVGGSRRPGLTNIMKIVTLGD